MQRIDVRLRRISRLEFFQDAADFGEDAAVFEVLDRAFYPRHREEAGAARHWLYAVHHIRRVQDAVAGLALPAVRRHPQIESQLPALTRVRRTRNTCR